MDRDDFHRYVDFELLEDTDVYRWFRFLHDHDDIPHPEDGFEHRVHLVGPLAGENVFNTTQATILDAMWERAEEILAAYGIDVYDLIHLVESDAEAGTAMVTDVNGMLVIPEADERQPPPGTQEVWEVVAALRRLLDAWTDETQAAFDRFEHAALVSPLMPAFEDAWAYMLALHNWLETEEN